MSEKTPEFVIVVEVGIEFLFIDFVFYFYVTIKRWFEVYEISIYPRALVTFKLFDILDY